MIDSKLLQPSAFSPRRPICRSLLAAAASSMALAAGWILTAAPTAAQPRDRFVDDRNRMVDEYIVREGIKNPAVIKAMRTVQRHLFVKSASRDQAYFDQAIAIGNKQTISPPFIVAYMTESLDPQPGDSVLEIGTGSGYQAAVLSGLVKDVYTIEIVPQLGKNAADVLKMQNLSNVHCKIGDGFKGWPEHAPFDKIIVTCSPEKVPQPLIDQLKEGGKMIIPLGERYEQVFYMFEKQQGQLVKTRLLPALFVPMTGDAEKNREVLPDPTHPEIHNGGFEVDNDGDGRPRGWHYQRQLTLEKDGAPEGKAFVKLSNMEPGRAAMLLQGMGIDGRAVSAVDISLQIRGKKIRNSGALNESAGFNIQFFDAERNPIGLETIGPWNGTFDWKKISTVLRVPAKTREAIIRIGLNGATGELGLDDVRMIPQFKQPAK